MQKRIVILGAGVIGLSSGIRLQEAGLKTRIVARDRTPNTTSDASAAIFFPFGVKPWDRVAPWAKATRAEFEKLEKIPEAGISTIELVEVYDRHHELPWWRELVPTYRRATTEELPGDYKDGFVTRVPLIDIPTYMPYLEKRYQELGGTIETRTVKRLDDLQAEADVLVNCSGVWAHDVVPDKSVFPLRGQTVKLANPGLTRGIIDELTPRALAHSIPRAKDVVCGGTFDKGNWSLVPNPKVEAGILAKLPFVEPKLVGAKILGRSVGLRPGRPEIRLDVEQRGRVQVVHNYGHAGAGVSLSWGCADEACSRVRSAA